MFDLKKVKKGMPVDVYIGEKTDLSTDSATRNRDSELTSPSFYTGFRMFSLGGVEHAILHLLYSRYITKFLDSEGLLFVSLYFLPVPVYHCSASSSSVARANGLDLIGNCLNLVAGFLRSRRLQRAFQPSLEPRNGDGMLQARLYN